MTDTANEPTQQNLEATSVARSGGRPRDVQSLLRAQTPETLAEMRAGNARRLETARRELKVLEWQEWLFAQVLEPTAATSDCEAVATPEGSA